MKVDYPTTEEINGAIRSTIEKAYPEKENIWRYLMRLYRHIGSGFLLHGLRELLLGILAVYVLLICLAQDAAFDTRGHMYVFIVVFSPAAFQAVLSLSIIGEKEQLVYDLEMTCKYTVYHILLLRMLLVSSLCTLLNAGLCVAAFWQNGMEEMLHMLFLSVTSLFLYSLLYLNLLLYSSRLVYQAALYVFWAAVNSLLCMFLPPVYLFLAEELPLVCHGIAWIVSAVLFGYRVNRYVYTVG